MRLNGRHKRKRWPAGVVILLAAALLSGPAAFADDVAGVLKLRRPDVLNQPADPRRFYDALELTMPRPVVPLTLEDAVARELLTQSRSLSETDALRTAQALCDEAHAMGYDPLLVLALIKVESGFNHYAISPVGAEGLMQIMPSTGAWMANKSGLERSEGHTFDPVLNVRLGTRYLAQLEKQFGSLPLALTAYNRGPTNVRGLQRRFGGHLPESVVDIYAGKVLRRWRELRSVYGDLPAS